MVSQAAAAILMARAEAAVANVGAYIRGIPGPLLMPAQTIAGWELEALDVTGLAGAPIPLKIRPILQGDSNDIYAISGLPPDAKLSLGGRYNDLWIVKRKHLEQLALLPPHDLRGTFQLGVTRAPTPARPAVTRQFKVRIEERPVTVAPPAPKVAEATTASIEQVAASKPRQYRRDPNDQMLFDRALGQFKKGDVAGARAIYEFLVARGDAEAAFALGETYDADALSRLFLEGVKADDRKALAWYQKAQRLGHPAAQARLNALDGAR